MSERESSRGAIRPGVVGACLLVLLLLGGLGVALAQLPRSDADAWSEAGAEFVVGIPASAVWERLQDLRLAHNYVPGVAGVEILSAKEKGVGASRRIIQEDGSTLDETVIEWEERRGFVIRLHQGEEGPPFPFDRARFRYRMEADGDRKTRLEIAIFYQPLGGWLGERLDAWVLNAEMKRRMEALGSSMGAYYEASAGVR